MRLKTILVESRLIYSFMKNANVYLADRLDNKIKEFEKYLEENK